MLLKNKYLHVIIIFIMMFIILTGCTNKEIDSEKLRDLEQVNLLEIKYLTLYERISGIQLTRLVSAIKNKESSTVESKDSENKEESKLDQQNKIENSIENSIETTKITYDNNVLGNTQESDWNTSKQICYELQNVVLDILSEMKNNNDNETAISFSENTDRLVSNVIKEDKEKSIENISQVYDYLLKFINDNISDKNIYQVKRLYYNSIKGLIYLESDEIEKYELTIKEIKDDSKILDELKKDENISYIIDKTNTLISSIDYKYKEDEKKNLRLKLIMLIKVVSNIDIYVQKVDNY